MSTTTVHHPIFARLYSWFAPRAEAQGAAEHRERLLAGAAGRVVEVGAGTGLNFRHYGAGVDEVLAVEPEAHMRRRAEEAAAHPAVTARIRVVDGVADAIPGGDDEYDVVVASLVLCSVPDQAAALAEARRVLRPGGELRFYEHVVARAPRAAAFQRTMDGSRLWPTVAGGCHMARDTVAAIEAAGFAVEACERFRFPDNAAGLPHVLGTARLRD